MRHSNTLWMLAIVTAIFVLIFLNLVLGSVSIPLQSVWHIIWNSWNDNLRIFYDDSCKVQIALFAANLYLSYPHP